MAYETQIEAAKTHFGKILEEQLARVERLKQQPEWLDFSRIKPIKIGMIGGDGIGRIDRAGQDAADTAVGKTDPHQSRRGRFLVEPGGQIRMGLALGQRGRQHHAGDFLQER